MKFKRIQNIFSPLRRLYRWCVGWGEHPHGTKALCLFSMIESIFFPIPVDPLLIAMGTGRPKKSLYFAFWATLFSVIGAFGGYALGALFWNLLEGYLITDSGQLPSSFQVAQGMFEENVIWAMVLAGFTLLPFKVFTVAAGLFGVHLFPFFIGCLIGRSGRFFFIGTLIYFFGPKIKQVIETHFEILCLLLGALLICGVIIYKCM